MCVLCVERGGGKEEKMGDEARDQGGHPELQRRSSMGGEGDEMRHVHDDDDADSFEMDEEEAETLFYGGSKEMMRMRSSAVGLEPLQMDVEDTDDDGGIVKKKKKKKPGNGVLSDSLTMVMGTSNKVWKRATICLGILCLILVAGNLVMRAARQASPAVTIEEEEKDVTPGQSDDAAPTPSSATEPGHFDVDGQVAGGGVCGGDDVDEDVIRFTALCGNGTLQFDAANTCECHTGFLGERCEIQVPVEYVSVVATSTAHTANLVSEEWWLAAAATGAGSVSVRSSYRIGYNGMSAPGRSLDTHIVEQLRELHATVGNAKTFGKEIVLASSPDLLRVAAVFALSSRPDLATLSMKPKIDAASTEGFGVTAGAATAYPRHWKKLVEFFGAEHISWVDGADEAFRHPDAEENAFRKLKGNVIELVSSPSFTDGRALPKPPTVTSDAKKVVDRSRFWPQYGTVSPDTIDADGISIFNLCEATGHCGSRLAWALVEDKLTARVMELFVGKVTSGPPRETQIRVHTLLELVLERAGTDECLFRATQAKMNRRWKVLKEIFATSSPVLHLLNGWNVNTAAPTTPAFALLQCISGPGREGCGAWLKMRANVTGHDNSDLHFLRDDASFVVLDLTMRDADFELLAMKLRTLVSELADEVPSATDNTIVTADDDDNDEAADDASDAADDAVDAGDDNGTDAGDDGTEAEISYFRARLDDA